VNDIVMKKGNTIHDKECRKAGAMRGYKILLSCIGSVSMVMLFFALGYGFNESHLDLSKVPDGCGACHKGHGKRATVMLSSSKEELCFKCHGATKKKEKGEAKTDIYSVMRKKSNHPVIDTSRYHLSGEQLPERSPATPRHVSCYDCHNPHKSTSTKTFGGVRGYAGKEKAMREAQKEYQVCYNCHSDSANLPAGSRNVANEFDSVNASFHPVEAVGKNKRVPSLKKSLSVSHTINCSDCHGNDDQYGPKGPHGSNFDFLLKGNYNRDPGIESSFSYELCYECHERTSILADESFKSHKRHVNYANASCYSCHASHGSRTYENLISFDKKIVFPNSSGQLSYLKLLPGRSRCYLKCHVNGRDFDHKATEAKYCINAYCVPGW
jgi:predicted CXXCH cytochrome family protein